MRLPKLLHQIKSICCEKHIAKRCPNLVPRIQSKFQYRIYDCRRLHVKWEIKIRRAGKNLKINLPYYRKNILHQICTKELSFVRLSKSKTSLPTNFKM